MFTCFKPQRVVDAGADDELQAIISGPVTVVLTIIMFRVELNLVLCDEADIFVSYSSITANIIDILYNVEKSRLRDYISDVVHSINPALGENLDRAFIVNHEYLSESPRKYVIDTINIFIQRDASKLRNMRNTLESSSQQSEGIFLWYYQNSELFEDIAPVPSSLVALVANANQFTTNTYPRRQRRYLNEYDLYGYIDDYALPTPTTQRQRKTVLCRAAENLRWPLVKRLITKSTIEDIQTIVGLLIKHNKFDLVLMINETGISLDVILTNLPNKKILKALLSFPLNVINNIISNSLNDSEYDLYVCPITHDFILYPVTMSDGFTYDYSAMFDYIESWRRNTHAGKPSSPMIRGPMESIIPNINQIIAEFITKYIIRTGNILLNYELDNSAEKLVATI